MDSTRKANKGEALFTQDSLKCPNYFTQKKKRHDSLIITHCKNIPKLPWATCKSDFLSLQIFHIREGNGEECTPNKLHMHPQLVFSELPVYVFQIQFLKCSHLNSSLSPFKKLLTLTAKVAEWVSSQIKTCLTLACLRLRSQFLSHMCSCGIYYKKVTQGEGRPQEEITSANCCRWIPALPIPVCVKKQTSN